MNKNDNKSIRVTILRILLVAYFIYDAFLIINSQFLLIPSAIPMFILGLFTIVLVIYAIVVVAVPDIISKIIQKRND